MANITYACGHTKDVEVPKNEQDVAEWARFESVFVCTDCEARQRRRERLIREGMEKWDREHDYRAHLLRRFGFSSK